MRNIVGRNVVFYCYGPLCIKIATCICRLIDIIVFMLCGAVS